MARIALVTGGVSGIGAATATLLKAAGYVVSTNYFGNGEDATAFAATTGIPVRELNVANYEASRAGVTASNRNSAQSISWPTMPVSRAIARSTR